MLLASAGETSHACKGRVAVSGPATWLRAGERVMVLPPGSIIRARRKLSTTGIYSASWRRLRTGGHDELKEPETEVRHRNLLGEPEQPRRGGKQRSIGRVEGQMHWHRDDLEHTELVVGEQAVPDRTNAERYREPRLHAVLAKAQHGGSGDEHASRQVIEHAVNPSRNEAHRLISSSTSNESLQPSGIGPNRWVHLASSI